MEIRSKIESILNNVDGRRRTRLLDINDIIRTISESLENGKACTGGGYVANAYFKFGRNPVQTIASAICNGDIVEIRIGVKSAAKGSSQYPKTPVDLIITKRQARRLVNRWRKSRGEYTKLPQKLKGLQITRDDSIQVGNCAFYTDKITSEIGKPIGTSDELFSFVKNKYPDQLSRAIRVINYVSKKLGV